MSYIPTPEQAEELVKRYNKEPFHIQHAETVSKVMGEFAKEYDPENVDFWRAVGMLHDVLTGRKGKVAIERLDHAACKRDVHDQGRRFRHFCFFSSKRLRRPLS